MTPTLFIIIAAGLILFFALGHTIGHFTRHNIKEEEAQKVFGLMQQTRFNQFGKMRTFDENYTGMSFNLLITLLTFSALLLTLAFHWQEVPDLTFWLLIPVSICCTTFAITGWRYFFPLPAITCLLAAISLVIAQVMIFTN